MKINLLGLRFSRLTVIGEAPSDKNWQARWLCECVCGTKTTVLAVKLKSGATKSCGCLAKEIIREAQARIVATNLKHGFYGTREYQSYSQAKCRCQNPKHHAWRRYGGRGIRFKFASFDDFLRELGPRPVGKSLDRFPDNDGHYESGNCRWATPKEQRNNRSQVAA